MTVEQELKKNVLERLSDILDSAYSPSSGGIGVQMYSVRLLQNEEELPSWARSALSTSKSNFLINSYVLTWTGQDSYSEVGPFHETPDSERHKALLRDVTSQYRCIERKAIRVAVSGDDREVGTVSGEKFTRDEYVELLQQACDNGLVTNKKLTSDFPRDLEVPQSMVVFYQNFISAGYDFPEELYQQIDSIFFSEAFRPLILRAAVHKLGAMLGLTDQLTFEAKALGAAVPTSYFPQQDLAGKQEDWRAMFGEELPGIGQLYENGHAILTQVVGDSDDPFLAHILAKPSLDQLS